MARVEAMNLSADQPGRLGLILVAEDEAIVASDLAQSLDDMGYSVVTVATGEEVIQKNREFRPDLVLMDIRLAGDMDGIQAAAAIQRERDVPVIYLTAHADAETLGRARDTVPFAYLVKPFNPVELRCAIEIAMHKHEIDARLRERERWLATTLQSIGDAVVATGPDRKVHFLNPVAEALTGWPLGEALGRSLDDILRLVDESGRAPIDSRLSQVLENRHPTVHAGEALLVGRDGAMVPIEDRAAPILGQEGEVLGAVMIFRDASDRRRTEEEIRQLNAELERRVVERTQELEAANKELEAFSYSVAHDLRAPLRGIDGFSQALIEEHAANLGADGLDHLHRVRRAAQRMGQIIDDLLRLARVAKADLHRGTVDLSLLARSIQAELQARVPDRAVTFAIQDDVRVQGDRQLLHIALENLLGNAWKFTSKVEDAVIEVGRTSGAGTPVCFVRDNGIGFDMQDAHKLFGAFQRLHGAGDFDGTGIGLAIVHRIVGRHGGRIWAEGQPGRGATFFFVV